MMNKIIRADSFDFGEPVVKLMEVHSKGVDKGWLNKTAALFDDVVAEIRPRKGKSVLHVITTGAMETYGCNSNIDAFNRDAHEFVLPFPKKGEPEIIMLDGGLDKYHKTYLDHGWVYKNHKDNKNPDNASGRILHEAINDKLNRGELIIEVDNDKWGGELDALSRGKPIFLSQGSAVKYDICSLCGHRRRRFPDACDHVKNHKLMITPEGHQVFVINDAPKFHDISGVVIPADKIAFTLRKVASGEILDGAELAELEGYTPPAGFYEHGTGLLKSARGRSLAKLSEMEKRVASVCESPAVSAFGPESGFQEIPERLAEAIKTDRDGALTVLKNMKVVLPLRLFLRLFSKTPELVDRHFSEVSERLPGLFSRMLVDGDFGCGAYDGSPGLHDGLARLLSPLAISHSIAAEPVKKRVVMTVIKHGPVKTVVMRKAASAIPLGSPIEELAREYGRYVLASCDGLNDDELNHVVIQKSVQ